VKGESFYASEDILLKWYFAGLVLSVASAAKQDEGEEMVTPGESTPWR
jgi:hypothetical protein